MGMDVGLISILSFAVQDVVSRDLWSWSWSGLSVVPVMVFGWGCDGYSVYSRMCIRRRVSEVTRSYTYSVSQVALITCVRVAWLIIPICIRYIEYYMLSYWLQHIVVRL